MRSLTAFYLPLPFARRFGMTRDMTIHGSGAGRNNVLFFACNYYRPAPLPWIVMSLVIPYRLAKGKGRQKAVRDLILCQQNISSPHLA